MPRGLMWAYQVEMHAAIMRGLADNDAGRTTDVTELLRALDA